MRAIDDGFWLAIGGQDDGLMQRWLLGLDGVATRIDSYAALPAGLRFDDASGDFALDGAGALFALARDSGQSIDLLDGVVVRFAPGGAAAIAFAEAETGALQIDSARLVTGP